MLYVDNNGQKQIAEDTAVWNEGYRIDLSSEPASYSKATAYTTADGHMVKLLCEALIILVRYMLLML